MRLTFLSVIFVWLTASASLLLARAGKAMQFNLPGPDDQMRLLQLREWLGGRAWWDLTQPRLGVDGLVFHWSRLPDLPLAMLTFLFTPFLGPLGGQGMAVTLWPLILLLVLFLAVSFSAAEFRLGRAAPVIAAILLITAYRSVHQFDPGRIDHHNIQIVLAAVSLFGVLGAYRRARWAILPGLSGALAIAIGVEGVPYVAAAALTLALSALDGRRGSRDTLALYGLTLSGALGLLYLQSGLWLAGHAQSCVAFSNVYLSAGILLGAGCAACAFVFPRLGDWRWRLAAGAAIGAAALAAFLALYPHCPAMAWSPEGRNLTADGYERDLARLWLGGIRETLNAAEMARRDYGLLFITYGFPLAGLVAAGLLARARPDLRPQIMACAIFLGVAFLISVFQNRGAMFSQMLAVPPAAGYLTHLLNHARREKGAAYAPLVAAVIALNGMTYILLPGVLPVSDSERTSEADEQAAHEACVAPKAMSDLAELPPGRIAAPINLGPFLLTHTPHSVLAAPYSTNLEGSIAAYAILASEPAEALERARLLEVDYIVTCPGASESGKIGRRYPDGLMPRLENGETLPGARPAGGADGPLRIYRLQD